MIRHAQLYETLTGEPADPTAQVKAAIAFAKKSHAERLSRVAELKALTNAKLAGVS